jgi:hypothetical protein
VSRSGSLAGLLFAVFLAGSVHAESQTEADDFCRRMGRNKAIFEPMLQATTAEALPKPGAMLCTWSFDEVALDSTLLASQTAARQTILMAVRPRAGAGVNHIMARASIAFLAAGLASI